MKWLSMFSILAAAVWGQASAAYSDGIIPHLPVGCGFSSTIILVNPTANEVGFQINFWTAGGNKKRVTISGIANAMESLSGIIKANGSREIQIDRSKDEDPECFGWAEVAADDVLAGYVVLTQTYVTEKPVIGPIKYEFSATVPFASRFASRWVVPFNHSDGRTTSLALVNPSPTSNAAVTIDFLSTDGKCLCSEARKLFPREQQAFVLSAAPLNLGTTPKERFLLNRVCADFIAAGTGVARIRTTELELSGFALRFYGFNGEPGFVSIPAQTPITRIAEQTSSCPVDPTPR